MGIFKGRSNMTLGCVCIFVVMIATLAHYYLYLSALREKSRPLLTWPVCAACRCGLNAMLIGWFAAAHGQPELQQLIATLLQITGAYSISGLAMNTLPLMASSCLRNGHVRCQAPS